MASLTDDNEAYAKSGKRYGWLLIIRCTRPAYAEYRLPDAAEVDHSIHFRKDIYR